VTGGLLWTAAEASFFLVKTLLVSCFAGLLTAAPSLACAGCRVMTKDSEATTVMAGVAFSWGVVAMLVFLFALCSGLGWFVMKTIKAVDAGRGSAQ
jgi:hypothetical protein